ncbi:hypothetical protein [Luteimonas sp. MC1895]|uniref:hypothetical protein n=1 Tax=Luteimonas sp. MC1895 TaxID=2819513 RepID=UPI0018F06FB7|nr:hypothetical protein [Luteimonas sp. MC1895]MBJ6979006.1 hypothetical protein [Luteimonas sp. MC1895]
MDPSAWINGRTLQDAVRVRGTPHRFGKIDPTSRVALDLSQDSYLLGIERTHGYTFLFGDDTLVTIHDFDLTGTEARFAPEEVLELGNMKFTRNALDSAAAEFAAKPAGNDPDRFATLDEAISLGSVMQSTAPATTSGCMTCNA